MHNSYCSLILDIVRVLLILPMYNWYLSCFTYIVHVFLYCSYITDIAHLSWVLSMCFTWWRHQMVTFSALLAICAGNSPVTGEFPTQRPVTRCFDVYFDLHPNRRLSKQSSDWWFETPSRPLWCHSNVFYIAHVLLIPFNYCSYFSRIVDIDRVLVIPDSKVHGAHMGLTWGRQDPGGPHVGHVNLSIWDIAHV